MQFDIRELTDGPADLRDQLPVTLNALSLLYDTAGHQQYWCTQLEHPVQYHFPPESRPRGLAPQFVAEDEEGPFLWVYVLVLTSHDSSDLQVGADNAAVDIGYVTDLSLGSDTVFDGDKVRWIAQGLVSVYGDDDQPSPDTSAPASVGNPPTSGATGELGNYIDSHVRHYITQLAGLAGTQFSDDIPQAVPLSDGQAPPADRPSYTLEGTLLRYHSLDASSGDWGWRTTEDPDELVYWILDDLVRSLAYRWANTTPAAAQLDEQGINRLLWIPYWLTLLAALNPEWHTTTEAAIHSS
ncbi:MULTISPECIES: hypothetical protein [Mycolicibacter]|uniref:Uncharacterized protein n=2 Tax=Mycolicibacter TaxID=1073531 RepID=A0ABU5XMJ5_9MYCO|nr:MULTISPECIES: hypothetical protein [unclassified Mycolicibacter]MEB3022977.1 hypothetical protein [Mycolicibacter sp. MYC098]MEB3033487.1 hypothetical protein [Mycolicibacter sp. MYC340]